MKRKLKNNIRIFSVLLVFISVAVLLSSCHNKTEKKDDMSGMDMENDPSMDSHSVANKILPPDVVISNQLTINPVIDKKDILIQANGIVQFDERRNKSVSAYFGGRIEKLYVRYNYQYVTKGQRIMDIYSPELLTAQENYLFLLKSASEKNLIQKAKEQLLLFGLTQEQITQIEKSGKAFYSLPVFTNYEGYILFGESSNEKMQSSSSTQKSGMDMGTGGKTTATTNSGNKEPGLIEGMYLNKGEQLFTVNDLKSVWVILSIEANNASSIKVNDKVTITTETTSDDKLEGKINFIEPVINQNQKFISARVYIDNSSQTIKNNLLVNASIEIKSGTTLWIPNSAILDLGIRKIIWLKTGIYGKGKGTFVVKEIKTGKATEQFTEIVSGLTEKDEIIKIAGFMNDSETLIQ
jgi:Cu(I)/Ag(I) efflux system membrane fusion protein